MGTANVAVRADERVRRVSGFRRSMARPELAAVLGTLLVWALFASLAGHRVQRAASSDEEQRRTRTWWRQGCK